MITASVMKELMAMNPKQATEGTLDEIGGEKVAFPILASLSLY